MVHFARAAQHECFQKAFDSLLSLPLCPMEEIVEQARIQQIHASTVMPFIPPGSRGSESHGWTGLHLFPPCHSLPSCMNLTPESVCRTKKFVEVHDLIKYYFIKHIIAYICCQNYFHLNKNILKNVVCVLFSSAHPNFPIFPFKKLEKVIRKPPRKNVLLFVALPHYHQGSYHPLFVLAKTVLLRVGGL